MSHSQKKSYRPIVKYVPVPPLQFFYELTLMVSMTLQRFFCNFFPANFLKIPMSIATSRKNHSFFHSNCPSDEVFVMLCGHLAPGCGQSLTTHAQPKLARGVQKGLSAPIPDGVVALQSKFRRPRTCPSQSHTQGNPRGPSRKSPTTMKAGPLGLRGKSGPGAHQQEPTWDFNFE